MDYVIKLKSIRRAHVILFVYTQRIFGYKRELKRRFLICSKILTALMGCVAKLIPAT